MFKPVLFKLWKFKPHNVQTSLGSNNYIDQTTDYYISISLNSSSNCTGTATTATTWPRSCHAPCCSALSLWCLPCRGAVHRCRVMARGTRPLDVSRHGVAQCAMRGGAWHGLRRGAMRGGAWHGAWRGAVRGVRPPDEERRGVGQRAVFDRSTCRVVSWCGVRRGVQRRGAVRGVRPPDVGQRGVGQRVVFGRSMCRVASWRGAWCGVRRRGAMRGGGWHGAHDVRRGVARCAACGGAWRGVQQHGAVRGVRPPDVGRRGVGAPCRVVVRHAAVGCTCCVVVVWRAAVGCTVPRHHRASCYGGSCRRCMSPGVASPGCHVAVRCHMPHPRAVSRCSTVPCVVSLSRIVLWCGTAHCLCVASQRTVSCHGMLRRVVLRHGGASCVAVVCHRRIASRVTCRMSPSCLVSRVALQRGAAARHAAGTLLHT